MKTSVALILSTIDLNVGSSVTSVQKLEFCVRRANSCKHIARTYVRFAMPVQSSINTSETIDPFRLCNFTRNSFSRSAWHT